MHVALEGNLSSMDNVRNTYKILGENPEVKRPTHHYLTQFTQPQPDRRLFVIYKCKMLSQKYAPLFSLLTFPQNETAMLIIL
jgi:hypothetical protein